ncbi:AAA family ATPase [Candidatus Micrarchaeota archaeon]|nr:AAA family ATPase [Candidatus Micrarchaeota archaeon]
MTRARFISLPALPRELDGHVRTPKGVYTPGKEMISRILDGHRPGRPEAIIGQEGTLQRFAVAQKLQRPILLAGPTGPGKSLLARVFAQRQEMPLIQLQLNSDTTEAKLKGYLSNQVFVIELGNSIQSIKANVFAPSPLAIAAMAGEPVVLFLDELHKMREGVSSIIHPLVNKKERALTMIELTGETYRLHPETVVICALNNQANYGSGFERIDPALRRRFAPTIFLDLTEDAGEFASIVDANISEANAVAGKIPLPEGGAPPNFDAIKAGIISAVCDFNKMKGTHMRAREGDISDQVVFEGGLDEEAVEGVIEKITPDSVIAALEFIQLGVDVRTAVEECIVNPIVRQFGATVTSLISFFEGKKAFGDQGN